MSMLAMAAPTSHPPFRRDFSWEAGRSSDYNPAMSRVNQERVSLPSIRQAFPELQLRVDPPARAGSTNISPTNVIPEAFSPPEYIYTPTSAKRRRLSADDDVESERARQIPRLYESPARSIQRQGPPAPSRPSPSVTQRIASDAWAGPTQSSPYPQVSIGHPHIPSLTAIDRPERMEGHQPLSGMVRMPFEAIPAPIPPSVALPGRAPPAEEYLPESVRSGMVHLNTPALEPVAPGYRQGASYPYGYHHPSRGQSLSLGSIHSFDRIPFTAPGYGSQYGEYARAGELGGLGVSGDGKARKRRGNLPKETTDKLRAWFVAHLHHPYPTEDEKQDLMRQTGLQMNQISNWFINARRRQLPAMISSARAESDAMSNGRGGTDSGAGKVLPSTERVEYPTSSGKRESPVSDGSGFEDDLEGMSHHRRAVNMKRGSV